jgi:glycogen debranching enzyme
VQGYAYAAYTRIAHTLDRIGEHAVARELRDDAASLRRRFNQQFWLEDLSYYALALDGLGAPARSVASNAAHCLWTGIIAEEHADEVVRTLMSDRMFSGWGIRTLAAGTARYNPIGYHLGTIWPHDNSIAAMGLKTYAFTDELNTLADALFDAAYSFPYFRLPELFGGQTRARYSPPVPYPVACRPQSWAAGSLPFVLQAMLGLHPCAPERLDVTAACALDRTEGGLKITTMHLTVRGRVPNIDAARFRELAATAEKRCPVANAIRNNVEITLDADLAA